MLQISGSVANFSQRMTVDFKGVHFPRSVILYAVLFYIGYPVSYRDLQEIMLNAVSMLTTRH